MTQPTPAELREAAILLRNWFIQSSAFPDDKDEAIYTLATHYLSHFPADGQDPITADWLREEWPTISYNGEIRIDGATGRFYLWPEDELHWTHAGNTTATLTTRQQFRDLMRLLGIEPKRKESE